MSRFCPKCGNELSPTANVCPKCGTPIRSATTPQNSGKAKGSSSIVSKLVSALFAVIILGGGCLYLFQQAQNESVATTASEENEQPTEKEATESPHQESDEKQTKSEQKKEIKYQRFKDPVFGFSFDFNADKEKPLPPKDESPGSAVTYKMYAGDQKQCAIVSGSLFMGFNRPINIESIIKRDRSNYPRSERYQNVDMHAIASNAYEVTYDRDDTHFIVKYYFGRVGTRDEAHYIQIGYFMNQTDEDALNEAKHIYDSFKPGVIAD